MQSKNHTPRQRNRRLWRAVLIGAAILLLSSAVFGLEALHARQQAAIAELRMVIAEHAPDTAVPEPRTSPAPTPAPAAPEAQADAAEDPWLALNEALPKWDWANIIWEKEVAERTPEDWAWIRVLLLEHQEALSTLRQLLEAGEPLGIPRSPFDSPSPLLAGSRLMARVLKEQTILLVREGNMEGAVDSLLVLHQLASAMHAESGLLPYLVALAIDGIAHATLEEAFPPGSLRPPHLERVITVLAGTDHRQALTHALSTNAYDELELFAMVRGGENLWADSPKITARVGGFLLASPLGRPFVNRDEAGFSQLMTRYLEVAPLPYHEALPRLEALAQDYEHLARTRPITGIILDYMERLYEIAARSEALNDLAQLGLLLESHDAEHGAYPERLEELAPGLGRGVPVDPFSGAPYLYESGEDGFLLYSVGRNQQDNGGHHHLRNADIVWRGRWRTIARNLGFAEAGRE